MWRRLLSSNLKTLAASAARSTPIHTRSLISPYASASLFNLRHFTADSADGAVKKRVKDVMPIATGHEREEREAERQALEQRLETWERKLDAFNLAVARAHSKKRQAEAAQKAADAQEITRELENTTDAAAKKRADDEWDEFVSFLRPDFLYNLEGDEVDERVEDENDMPVVNYPSYGFGTKEEPAIIESFYDKRAAGCFGGVSKAEHEFVCFWLKKGKPRKCPVCPQYFELKVVGPGGLPDKQPQRRRFKLYVPE